MSPSQKPYAVAGATVYIKKKKGAKAETASTGERLTCGCQGTVHPFINNCLECGRISCEVEGEGSCPHCGTFVRAREVESEEGI